ncbi:MAG: STAS domain-containing protein [Acidobacteriaceae bacterium]|nr:STAS domain-containing protein [Acidobacteriaceae bacterium]
MEISHHQIMPETAVITVAGRVMLGPESEQITTLVSNLLGEGTHAIIFNIAGVTAIDSTGIGRFIASYNKIAAAGGEMRITGATGYLFQAFHVCRLDTVFRFYPSLDEACKSL